MRFLFLGLLTGSLIACHPTLPLPISATNALFSRQNQALKIEDIYPIQNRQWTFQLSQTQNGQDNTKFKILKMWTEGLPAQGDAQQAVLRRAYPNSSVTPKPSLVKQFSDRVELSRYQEDQGFLGLLPPAPQALSGTPNYIIALKLPLVPNQAWEGRQFKGGTETIRTGDWENITVPAGQFQAVKIEHELRYENGKQDYLRYWYAKGVGMVKMHEELTVYFGQWLKLQSSGELISYQ